MLNNGKKNANQPLPVPKTVQNLCSQLFVQVMSKYGIAVKYKKDDPGQIKLSPVAKDEVYKAAMDEYQVVLQKLNSNLLDFFCDVCIDRNLHPEGHPQLFLT